MSSIKTCPACNYTRQPTDYVPEWECPKCQKAYNKSARAEHLQESLLTAQSSPEYIHVSISRGNNLKPGSLIQIKTLVSGFWLSLSAVVLIYMLTIVTGPGGLIIWVILLLLGLPWNIILSFVFLSIFCVLGGLLKLPFLQGDEMQCIFLYCIFPACVLGTHLNGLLLIKLIRRKSRRGSPCK